jgi:hypothetical protein
MPKHDENLSRKTIARNGILFHRNLTGAQYRVASFLIERWSEDWKRIFPGLDCIAFCMGMSKSSVVAALESLCEGPDRLFDRKRGGRGRGRVTEYFPRFEAFEKAYRGYQDRWDQWKADHPVKGSETGHFNEAKKGTETGHFSEEIKGQNPPEENVQSAEIKCPVTGPESLEGISKGNSKDSERAREADSDFSLEKKSASRSQAEEAQEEEERAAYLAKLKAEKKQRETETAARRDANGARFRDEWQEARQRIHADIENLPADERCPRAIDENELIVAELGKPGDGLKRYREIAVAERSAP